MARKRNQDAAAEVVPATEFKARCLALLDYVATTGTPIVVTKHGRPVARIVPAVPSRPLRGSITILTDTEQELFSTGEVWEVEEPGDE